jgi:hypothetical protein
VYQCLNRFPKLGSLNSTRSSWKLKEMGTAYGNRKKNKKNSFNHVQSILMLMLALLLIKIFFYSCWQCALSSLFSWKNGSLLHRHFKITAHAWYTDHWQWLLDKAWLIFFRPTGQFLCYVVLFFNNGSINVTSHKPFRHRFKFQTIQNRVPLTLCTQLNLLIQEKRM